MKTIFFDFGRTLVEHPEDGAGKAIIQKRGITVPADVALVQKLAFDTKLFGNLLDEGSLSREDYIRSVLEKAPERLHEQVLGVLNYHISELPMIDGMKELLQKLRADGFSLYITSNLDVYHTAQMLESDFVNLLDGMIFSSQIKVRKPFAGFFEAALERFGVNAEDCLFIDDLEENVVGAQACGIKGLVFDGNWKTVREFIYQNAEENK